MTLHTRRERADRFIADTQAAFLMDPHKMILRHNRALAAVRALWVSRANWLAVAEQLATQVAELERIANAAVQFINERPEYVNACRNAHPDNVHDYHRWQGGAEARRQLAERLGWTVPYEHGDKTEPAEAANQRPAVVEVQG